MKVANEIRNQIGNKALMMIGAKNLGGTKTAFLLKLVGMQKKLLILRLN